MNETKTQWFVRYGGLFIPIADNVVRDGYYIMDSERGDSIYSVLLWLCTELGGKYVNSTAHDAIRLGGNWLMALPAQDCEQLLRVDYDSAENVVEITVEQGDDDGQ